MVKKFSQIKVILTILLTALAALTSACNVLSIGQESPKGQTAPAIFAPKPLQGETVVKTLVGSPLQIQSAHPGDNISRVELWVTEPGQPNDKLVRSDMPINGVVLQEWIPQQPGEHTIKTKTFYTGDQAPQEQSLKVVALNSQAVSLVVAAVAEQPTSQPAVEFEPPAGVQAATPDAQIAVFKQDVAPTAEATPVRRYPPPPPAPGVSPGPTQAELPSFGPPVCDAAQYLGVYASDTSRRVMVIEDDDVPAKTVGGTLVHRAWRMQNIGTCTWGTDYELAFYGGREMGSGGVAFEAPFPTDPGRRNALVDTSRLIVPQGKPNQTAVLEVLLNAPVTPGIHQSYWRMRNPQGVYFGPIVGVTFETVRTCASGIYGAPVINKFEILGVGNVYRPNNPVNIQAKYGDAVTLEWNILNATNFDIVIEDPTGNIQSTSTPDASGRVSFTPKTLGRHTITLYADNGSCTVTAEVLIDVIPPTGDQFRLDLILNGSTSSAGVSNNIRYSAAVAPGSAQIEWHHFDQETDKFTLFAESYQRSQYKYCPVVDSIFGWEGHCYMTWSDWTTTDKVALEVGGTGDAQGAATIANVEYKLCPSSFDSSQEEYGIRYQMYAEKGGRPASPSTSNTVDVQCKPLSGPPTELNGAATEFNPN